MNLFDVYPLFDIVPERALGCWIWDNKGDRYLDFYGGHAVISIGHSHPRYVKSISEQLKKIAFYSNSIIIPLQKELAEKLGKLSCYEEYALFLCNSGAEANENALKLASFHNGRKKVIAFEGSFHGRTSLAVAATNDTSIQAPINLQHDVIFIPLSDEPALARNIDDSVCAVIIEGIQGVAGIQTPTINFLREIKSQCEKSGALMIVDEVQSGYGRTGNFFAHSYSGVKPDIITVAKGMGNGFPIAGILINPSIKAKHGMLGTTFGGSYLACAAGIAVLDIIKDEKLVENAKIIGEYLHDNLYGVVGIKEIRGRGLMLGVELISNAKAIREDMLYNKKIFTGSSSNKNTIRLLPPLTITKAEAGYFLERFSQSIKSQLKPAQQ